ncbi:laminin subunit alpha-2 isoform X2 [Emydura macquarii macquarii]|uniref:laminin subunit alpha-2 isoform X2 n=1 Tax=Emydura macquarii macquarii TaxID=1129001 RepID=UPI00352B24AA
MRKSPPDCGAVPWEAPLQPGSPVGPAGRPPSWGSGTLCGAGRAGVCPLPPAPEAVGSLPLPPPSAALPGSGSGAMARGSLPLLLLLSGLATPASGQAQHQPPQPRGLFPAVLNLAANAIITTNATCGETGAEMYCKLVEHVPGQPARNPQCRICDQNSSIPHQRHPITNAIDGKNTWWQSPSIQNGIEYHYVTITLDLRQVFQIAYVIVKASNAPRPGNWILERSLDGVHYQPWHYYAITDTECLTRYNIYPRTGPPSYAKDDEVICSSFYSRIHPLENGEIHTSLINGRPSADDPSQVLLEFTSARFIRLRFQRIRTLNADLMMFAHKDPSEIDHIVTRRYYYSVKDISVGGMCICYGHARACPWDPATNRSTCECEHHTCGESCNHCCPGFNQKPWRAGTFLVKSECEECNCHGKTRECYYDQNIADRNQSLNVHGEYSGGGVCINCTENTAGINCETCIDGYFRPKKVLPSDSKPCYPCSCDPIGSLHGTCVKDEKHAEGGMLPGFCLCKPGYAGKSCNRCASGYMGYPDCMACNCSLKGSLNDDPCIGSCICKENVEGENCDHCKPSFFNLQQDNPRGCEECFCSGKTNICIDSHWTYRSVGDMSGWYLTDLSGLLRVTPQKDSFDGPQQLSISNVAARRVLPLIYYWSAPSPYLGNKITAAGGHLKFTISYDLTGQEEAVQTILQSDIIIEGAGLRISTSKEGIHLQPFEEHTEEVVLKPDLFTVHGTDSPVSKREFMTVLANIKRLLIRATYSYGMDAIYRLSGVSLETADRYSTGRKVASAVEVCQCPPGYSGTSCESCWPGQRRVNGTIFGGICEQCTCFSHAEFCDDITGECLDCKHNTGGPYCDRCLPGFYGDPTKGTTEDCQLCACPLTIPSNNFSPTCHLDRSHGLICDECPLGYAGPRCERCAEGYFGQPLIPGGSCRPCQCNDNLDFSIPGSCDSLSGACLICKPGITGQYCERCADGYFGDALDAKNCQSCHCNINGSISEICNSQTGQCECKPNVVGRRCNKCKPNYFWASEKQFCIPCGCSRPMSLRCDMSGRCICKSGFMGKRCELSRQVHKRKENPQAAQQIQVPSQRWGFTGASGCPRGAYRPVALPGTFGLPSSRGCVPCNCNSFGSKSFDCDENGQCHCQPGIAGKKCDRCAHGFYNFEEGGCTACECSHLGGNCDPVTGRCVCPPNTIGEKCDKCAPNYWGHDIVNGCKACDCSVVGSLSFQCNLDTGYCFCHPEFSGDKCTQCRLGYWKYPQCITCDCFLAGTDPQTCDGGMEKCSCADRTGQCSCKVNVEGVHCDRCRSGMFGLYAKNPLGCSSCYCFGLTTQCSEAKGLIRMWLTLKPEQVVLQLVDENLQNSTTKGVVFQHPEIVANIELVMQDLQSEPIYWKLPEQFGGRKLTAYGGKLKYAIYFEAREETGFATYKPQVIIRGGPPTHTRIIIQHMSAPLIGQLTRHEIEMTEHEWKYHGDDPRVSSTVTREDFMDVLYNIHYILIKATHGSIMRQSRISEISMEVAEEGSVSGMSPHAPLIEKCDCPQGYSGLSCEECSPGFYRFPSMLAGRRPGPSLGTCAACQCHGHSNMCDPETSICQNCRHNTDGDHCERCAVGFYGNVRGSPEDCHPCACPLTISSNNFSPACVVEGLSDYRCIACPPGYEGQYCERCSPGYSGDPRTPGGSCQECECHPDGSLPIPCDPVTGQCTCKPGSTGWTCAGCKHQHVRDGMECVSCDDECTGLLLNDLDRLNQMTLSVNLSGPLPPPYKMLYGFENTTQELKHLLSPQRAPERLLQLAQKNLDTLMTEMDELLTRATKVTADGEQTGQDAERTNERAKSLGLFIKGTLQAAEAVNENAIKLNETLGIPDKILEKSLEDLQGDIDRMMVELRRRKLNVQERSAQDELKNAEALLNKVKKLFGEPMKKNEELKNEVRDKMADYKNKVDDARDLLREATGKIREANRLSAINQRNMTVVEKRKQAVESSRQEAENTLKEGNDILDEASRLANKIKVAVKYVEDMGDMIQPIVDQLKDKIDDLSQDIQDRMLPEKVLQAENYSAQLNESSAILDGILAEAKNLSFNATVAFKAYTNIKDYIDEAEKVAKEAKARANEAMQLASDPQRSLKDGAKNSLQKSFRVLNEAKKTESDVKENGNNLNSMQNRLKNADEKNSDLLRALNDTFGKLSAIPNDTAAKVQAAKDKASQANTTANDVLARIKDLNQNLLGLKSNYSKLADDVAKTNAVVKDPTKSIADADATVKTLEKEADRLLDKLKPIKELQDNLGKNISQIKELINQARKQANSIKVSVSSGGDCIRTYRPEIKKGSYNIVIVNVKTAVADNLLFYLGSAKFTDFLAIEMRKGKVNFLWDVGSGVGRVEYPDLTIDDAFWYRIEATRTGKKGTISVRALDGPKATIMPSTFSAVSPPGYTILDVDANAMLFVGGLTGKIKKSDAVRVTTFTGCMGETYLDSKPIGLWNFRDTEGDCKGCAVSPQVPDSEGTVQFDGDGYALVSRPVRWNPNVSMVMFKFKTFSSSALLMYLATDDLKDFMSVELSDGHIKVSYDLGSGTTSAVGNQNHNDGKWKSFTLSRIQKQANVSIVDIDTNQEEIITTTSTGSHFGLNLKADEKIYFGGLPTLRNLRPEVNLKKYAGCLRDIEISRTPYNILNSPDFVGITKGCTLENLYTVSFPKPGFVELQPVSFDMGTEINLSFSTKNESGVILFGTGGTPIPPRRKRRQTGQAYYAVFLNKGRLEVHIFTGIRDPRRITIKPESGDFHDGRAHSVRIERLKGMFTVQVDEDRRQTQRLPTDQPIAVKKLYVGGTPAHFQVAPVRNIPPFEGCIWNLVINAIPMDFAEPVSFKNADIGHCPTLEPEARPPEGEDEDEATHATVLITPEPDAKEEKESTTTTPRFSFSPPPPPPPTPAHDSCAADTEPAILEGGKQFGLSRNSHIAAAFDDTKVKNRLTIEFEVQTEADSGLLFYMARINHADFATVQIKNGLPYFSYDLGSGDTNTMIPNKINDGQWHKVKIFRTKQEGILLVDGVSNRTTSPKKADILDVVGMLYVGGLPINYTTRRIGPVTYSIDGCIRNFKMTEASVDLDNPTSSFNVGKCFTSVEKGTFFDGTGFAKTVGTYKVGTDLLVEFEFRTTRMNAVLLGISSQKMDGLGIELVDENLMFHVDNGAGRFSAIYKPDKPGSLCDGRWHKVTANKIKHRLELTVDGSEVDGSSPNGGSSSTDTNDPVFVGGYPAGLNQFGLTTNIRFKGCIRSLKLTKGTTKPQEINFSKALELKGVQPLSCPTN